MLTILKLHCLPQHLGAMAVVDPDIAELLVTDAGQKFKRIADARKDRVVSRA